MDPIVKHIIDCIQNSDQIAVDEIILYGSQLDPTLIDPWSDIDLKIVLSNEPEVTTGFLDDLFKSTGVVIGKEILFKEDHVVYRAVVDITSFERIQMVDLNIQGIKGLINTESFIDEVHLFWFTHFLAAKKFMRNDYLIGTHLLLENLKRILELKMNERDLRKGTTMHRYGDQENIVEILGLQFLNFKDNKSIAEYMIRIGNRFDQYKHLESIDYMKRCDYLERYLNHGLKY